MTSQIVVGAQRVVHVLAAVRGGECDAHNAAYIARGQPALLIVVGAVQLPALILKASKRTSAQALNKSQIKTKSRLYPSLALSTAADGMSPGSSPKQPSIDSEMRQMRLLNGLRCRQVAAFDCSAVPLNSYLYAVRMLPLIPRFCSVLF